MRSAVLMAARAVLLAGPAVIAFFSGGYFPDARAWAGLIAWALVAVAALVVTRPCAADPGDLLALVGLGLFAVWTLASTIWAPVAGSAYHAGQLALAYCGTLLAATMLLRGSRARASSSRRCAPRP